MGTLIGYFIPATANVLDKAFTARISWPIAVLIRLMIYPMQVEGQGVHSGILLPNQYRRVDAAALAAPVGGAARAEKPQPGKVKRESK